MRVSSYLKIGCACIFTLGLLGEISTAVYDETTNERLRRQYTLVREDVAGLEREVRLYERCMECVKHPDRSAPVRTIDATIVPPFEIRTEGGQ